MEIPRKTQEILRVVLSQYHEKMLNLEGSHGVAWHMVDYLGTGDETVEPFRL